MGAINPRILGFIFHQSPNGLYPMDLSHLMFMFCLNLYQCFRIGLWISNSNWFTNCCWKSEQRVGKKYFLTQRHNPGSSSQISLSRADKSKWEPDKSIVTEISTFCGAAGAQFGFCSKIHESRSKRVPMTGALIMQPSFNYQHCTSQKLSWSPFQTFKHAKIFSRVGSFAESFGPISAWWAMV